jgi:hypothetical protein
MDFGRAHAAADVVTLIPKRMEAPRHPHAAAKLPDEAKVNRAAHSL